MPSKTFSRILRLIAILIAVGFATQTIFALSSFVDGLKQVLDIRTEWGWIFEEKQLALLNQRITGAYISISLKLIFISFPALISSVGLWRLKFWGWLMTSFIAAYFFIYPILGLFLVSDFATSLSNFSTADQDSYLIMVFKRSFWEIAIQLILGSVLLAFLLDPVTLKAFSIPKKDSWSFIGMMSCVSLLTAFIFFFTVRIMLFDPSIRSLEQIFE